MIETKELTKMYDATHGISGITLEISNGTSMSLLGVFALKETLTLDAFSFNLLIGAVLAAAIIGMYTFGTRNFNREKLVDRL